MRLIRRPRVLLFSGSARSGSLNGRLAMEMVKILALKDAEPTLVSLADYAMPIYDGDLEQSKGVPEAAVRLRDMMLSHEGIFIATPEYNQSLPALLKNTLDWISRIRPDKDRPVSPWKSRAFAIGSASPGHFGGSRSLLHLRQILELAFAAHVLPEQVVVPAANQAFSADGGLADERIIRQIDTLATRLIEEAVRYVIP